MDAYLRTCPECHQTFQAKTERGLCRNCGLFTRIGRDGALVAVLETEYQGHLPADDPRSISPLSHLFEAVELGGGTIAEGVRYGRHPAVTEVQRQLLTRFQEIVALLKNEVQSIEYVEVTAPSNDPDWIGSKFAESESLFVATWFEAGGELAVVCCLDAEGGRIEAVVLPR